MLERAADQLVPDPEVRREFGVSAMTLWRWDHDPEMSALGWPMPVQIRKRNYRPRHRLNEFKERMIRQAVARRDKHEAEAQHPAT